jgi:hypothetical protein
MPITTFSSADDGLEPNQRNRGHFIGELKLGSGCPLCGNFRD